MDLKWDDVRVFLALVRRGSITDAAGELGMDMSTVSRRLSALEETVGTVLFERSRDGVRPSAAAEELVPDAQEVEAAMRRIGTLAEGLEVTAEGVVRISVPPSLGEFFLVPRLGALRTAFPRLRLELHSSSAMADLTRREADLALRLIRPQSGDLVSTRVLTNDYAVFGTPQLVARLGVLSEWSEAPFVAWTAEFAQIPAARWLSKWAPGLEPVLRTNGLGAQLVAAQSGLGLAVLPTLLASGLVRPQTTANLAESLSVLPREDVWLVGHSALRRVPRVAAVWDFLRAEAATVDAMTRSVSTSSSAAAPSRSRKRRAPVTRK